MDMMHTPEGVFEITSAPEADLVVLDGLPLYPSDDPRWGAFTRFGRVAVYERTAPGDITERCRGARIVLTNKVPFTEAVIAALPSLEYIGVLATGYNIIDTAAAARAGVTVTNIPAYSTASVAQNAIALLLAITNRAEHYAAAVAAGRWAACPDFSFRDFPLTELDGKAFGVVGFGNTGAATARIAAALGMRVKVFTSKPAEALPAGYEKTDLDELFRTCDVVSLHCPLTPSTRALVNADRLAMMKRSAILINTSRGPVVDEEALARALSEGRIAAAGLDVLSQEPPLPDNPLLHAPGCVITPHIAWASDEARERLMATAISNLDAFVLGTPRNAVG